MIEIASVSADTEECARPAKESAKAVKTGELAFMMRVYWVYSTKGDMQTSCCLSWFLLSRTRSASVIPGGVSQ